MIPPVSLGRREAVPVRQVTYLHPTTLEKVDLLQERPGVAWVVSHKLQKLEGQPGVAWSTHLDRGFLHDREHVTCVVFRLSPKDHPRFTAARHRDSAYPVGEDPSKRPWVGRIGLDPIQGILDPFCQARRSIPLLIAFRPYRV